MAGGKYDSYECFPRASSLGGGQFLKASYRQSKKQHEAGTFVSVHTVNSFFQTSYKEAGWVNSARNPG